MAKRSQGPTFAELLKQPTWSQAGARESGVHAVRPGQYNAAGELFDPSGRPLLLQQEDITPKQAQELVRGGALIAHEACGCGGWTGCQPEWLNSDAVSRLGSAQEPKFVEGHGAPTWIDVWSSDLGQVIYLHGDVPWGDEIG